MSDIPRLPQDISSDGREIWDWADKLSARVQVVAEIKELTAQLHEMKTTCGSCSKWMTNICPRETRNAKGHKFGPSCRTLKCGDFEIQQSSKNSIDAAELKLKQLQAN